METDSKQFTVAEVLEAMEKAVAKRGADYVYEKPREDPPTAAGSQCLYVHHRGTEQEVPGCIVGQVYFDLLGELVPRTYEGASAGLAVRNTPLRLAIALLDSAQSEQDAGFTWGEALEAARYEARVNSH